MDPLPLLCWSFSGLLLVFALSFEGTLACVLLGLAGLLLTATSVVYPFGPADFRRAGDWLVCVATILFLALDCF